jgi:serine/threonine protein kinase
MASHPNLVRLDDFFEDQKSLYLVLELCKEDFFDYIAAREFKLTKDQVKDFCL